MPSFNTYVEVDFDWDDVIKKHSNAEDIANAIRAAGLASRVITALAEASADPRGPDDELPDPLATLDRLVDDYARGLPIDDQLRRIAYTHCGRVITAMH